MKDPWQGGTAYESFMGRWSTPVARRFLDWLAIPPDQRWLDVGCGTGSLTRLVLGDHRPQEIVSIDASADFIAHAQHSISDTRVRFRVGRAKSLELEAGSIDAVVSGLVLNFVPQPEAALAEMRRVSRPGGRIGVFLWDYADGMQMLRYFWDAAIELDRKAREYDEGRRFPLCQAGQLELLMRAGGLTQVEAAAIEVETVFRDFDDYWQPFLGNVGPAPSYVMSLEPKNRQKLEDRLRRSLPVDKHGSITLIARSWAVQGSV